MTNTTEWKYFFPQAVRSWKTEVEKWKAHRMETYEAWFTFTIDGQKTISRMTRKQANEVGLAAIENGAKEVYVLSNARNPMGSNPVQEFIFPATMAAHYQCWLVPPEDDGT
jgi:hypothetical protein